MTSWSKGAVMAPCGTYTRYFCRKRRDARECLECSLLRKSVYTIDHGVMLKLCKGCGRYKPLGAFYHGIRRNGQHVIWAQCKVCVTDRLRDKRHGRLSPATNND